MTHSKLYLDNVTFVMVNGLNPELSRLSLLETMRLVDFPEIIVWSPTDLEVPGVKWLQVLKDKPDQHDFPFFMWYKLPDILTTDYFLMGNWDAWVINPDMWSDKNYDYDWVGAPWAFVNENEYKVGHGLFRTKKLMKFIGDRPEEFQFCHPEDMGICQHHRPKLEKHGFKWADEALALQFMFDTTRPKDAHSSFMFHASFNFPHVLSFSDLLKRYWLMNQNEYIKDAGHLKRIFSDNPRWHKHFEELIQNYNEDVGSFTKSEFCQPS